RLNTGFESVLRARILIEPSLIEPSLIEPSLVEVEQPLYVLLGRWMPIGAPCKTRQDLASAVVAARAIRRTAREDLPAARRVAGALDVVRAADLDLLDPGFGAAAPSEADIRDRQLRRAEPLGHAGLPGKRDADHSRTGTNRNADLHLTFAR